MSITASLVKELRERTGAGMMECKKSLIETNGDIELAIETMRKKGMAQADKKAGRIAADGLIVIASNADGNRSAIVEVNSETDFVAKGDEFSNFANAVAEAILNAQVESVDDISSLSLENGMKIEDTRRALIAKLGENIAIRRAKCINSSGRVGHYIHNSKIGVVVTFEGGDVNLGRDIAMHVAASNPQAIDESGIDATLIEKERAIFIDQAAQSGKPENIIQKMVDGRINKFLKEITLVNQPFVKDSDITVGKLLKENNCKVLSVDRFEVGEGIEKKSNSFAEEVAAQVAASQN